MEHNKILPVTATKNPHFKVTEKEIKTSLLNTNHALHKLMDIVPPEDYIKNFKRYKLLYDIPCVVEHEGQYNVISSREDVIAAKECEIPTLKVNLIEGMDTKEVFRFMCFKTYMRKKKHKAVYDCVSFLKEFLLNEPEGKELREESSNVMSKALEQITGISKTTITDLFTIEKYTPGVVQKIDDGEISYTQALKNARRKREVEVEQKDKSDEGGNQANKAILKESTPGPSFFSHAIIGPPEEKQIQRADVLKMELEFFPGQDTPLFSINGRGVLQKSYRSEKNGEQGISHIIELDYNCSIEIKINNTAALMAFANRGQR